MGAVAGKMGVEELEPEEEDTESTGSLGDGSEHSGSSIERRSASEDSGSGSDGAGEDAPEALLARRRALAGQRAARPQQLADGRPVWPERWGISRAQVQELLERLRMDPSWRQDNNVYTLVSDFIVPWTRGHGVGYALLLNREAPKEVSVMISHAFIENAEDFLETVLRATGAGDVVYICALANYQAEDGVGPTIAEQLGARPSESPFWRVLAHIRRRGEVAGVCWRLRPCLIRLPTTLFLAAVLLMCLPVTIWRERFNQWYRYGGNLNIEEWHWMRWLFFCGCFWAASLLFARWFIHGSCLYAGRMVVVPNHEGDIYSRLWCVYEVFVAKTLGVSIMMAPTLAPAGRAGSRAASCSCPADEARIRAEIEASDCGYDRIDDAVHTTLRGAQRHKVGVWIKYTILQVVPAVAFSAMVTESVYGYMVLAPLAGFYAMMTAAAYALAFRTQGVLEVGDPSLAVLGAASLASTASRQLLEAWCIWIDELVWEEWWAQCLDFLLYEVSIIAMAPLAALCMDVVPRCLRVQGRLPIMLMLMVVIFSANLLVPRWAGDDVVTPEGAVVALLLSWSRVAPIYMLWTEAVHVGIKVREGRQMCRTAVAVLALVGFVWWFLSVCRAGMIVVLIIGQAPMPPPGRPHGSPLGAAAGAGAGAGAGAP